MINEIRERTNKLLEKADKPEEFTKDLQELLKFYADREATKNYLRIIPETGKFYGVPIPVLRIIAAEFGKFIRKEPAKAKFLLETIWNDGSFEARQIAGKCMEKFAPENPKICLDFISSALPELDNWAVCDNLAMFGVKPIVCQNPELVLPLSEKWIKDENKWVRRFGAVSLLGYKKVKTTDKVFKILDMVMEDEDKDVKKAFSWILRELTKKNPEGVVKFLTKCAKANPRKDTRWIIKDGMKKLSEDEQEKLKILIC